MRLVQIVRSQDRRVAVVDGEQLRLLDPGQCTAIYSLAVQVAGSNGDLSAAVQNAVGSDSLNYTSIYEGQSEWRLLPAFDHPRDFSRCLVSGTGLTHKASAENRSAMHKQKETEITDSIRMYRMGLEAGNSPPGHAGVQPEWFYKGNGSILKGHGERLVAPPYGWDGGEEPEIAGIYVIAPDGKPCRVGFTIGNEFSDHRMEKKNYLYLAPSKLRNCSIGPELTIGKFDFEDVRGTVSIFRDGSLLWSKIIRTGQKNMSHSVANLEHHHFKYEAHRQPGEAHVHFFGADAFSFGDGIVLESDDVMEVSFPQFGRALRNPVSIEKGPEEFVSVRTL
jgi:hypothetical protein